MERMNEMDFAFGANTDGLFIKKFQDIPDDHMQRLKEAREHSSSNVAGDMHRVASVPEVVVDKWMRDGFDVYTAPAKEIISRLKAEGLDYFITTTKRV